MVNIVLIEDDNIMASAIKLQLRVLLDFEYHIKSFSNKTSADEYISTTHCDILISDLNLPDSKNGDTVNHYCNTDNISNIIFMSGVADDLDADQIDNGQNIHFVMKDMSFIDSLCKIFTEKMKLKTM